MYEKMNTASPSNQSTSGFVSFKDANAPIAIREPGPTDKATETLGYLNQLDDLTSTLHRKLYGPTPVPPECEAKRGDAPCLEELMHMICHRSAMLVGEMQSILSRL